MKQGFKKSLALIMTVCLCASAGVGVFAENGTVKDSDSGIDSGIKDSASVIKGFKSLPDVDGGTAGDAKYATAQDAANDLLVKNQFVTAYAGEDEVEVEVAKWVDEDSYDPDTAGSYTFTTILSELPEGYTNPNGLKAEIEVVLRESDDDSTGGDSSGDDSTGGDSSGDDSTGGDSSGDDSTGGGSSSGGSSGGGSSSGGSSSSGNSSAMNSLLGSIGTTNGASNGSNSAASAAPVTTSAATEVASQAVAQAVASNAANVQVNFKNVSTISPAAFKAIADEAAKAGVTATVTADTMNGRAVQSRVYLNAVTAAALTNEVNLSVTVGDRGIESLFGKYFSNDIAVVRFGQTGSFGMSLQVASKVDLSALNVEQLMFYTYDPAANTYQRMAAPAGWIDVNGYLHFTTDIGNAVIITDTALTRK